MKIETPLDWTLFILCLITGQTLAEFAKRWLIRRKRLIEERAAIDYGTDFDALLNAICSQNIKVFLPSGWTYSQYLFPVTHEAPPAAACPLPQPGDLQSLPLTDLEKAFVHALRRIVTRLRNSSVPAPTAAQELADLLAELGYRPDDGTSDPPA